MNVRWESFEFRNVCTGARACVWVCGGGGTDHDSTASAEGYKAQHYHHKVEDVPWIKEISPGSFALGQNLEDERARVRYEGGGRVILRPNLDENLSAKDPDHELVQNAFV